MKSNTKLEQSNYVVFYDSSFEEAMKAITANRHGAILVVDANWHLVGVVSDGDIRRAMLSGAIMRTPIRQAINYNVVSVFADDKAMLKNPEDIFSKYPHINIIPIIDKNNIVVDIIARGTSLRVVK